MNLIFHLIFIIIYSLTMSRELKRKESFELHQALQTKFTTQTFSAYSSCKWFSISLIERKFLAQKTFADLSSVEDIIDWINNVTLFLIWLFHKQTSLFRFIWIQFSWIILRQVRQLQQYFRYTIKIKLSAQVFQESPSEIWMLILTPHQMVLW